MTRVALIRSTRRADAVPRAIDLLGPLPIEGRSVLIKPNFNTADPFPASTHNETLEHLIVVLRAMGTSALAVGDRSGPADTDDVLREKRIFDLCRKLDVQVLNFETLDDETGWVRFDPPGSHWRRGVRVARPVAEAEALVYTCCLKTHGFGGVYTGALKLTIGAVHRGEMTELHSSIKSMRQMIAEANVGASPCLILMDALEVFTDKGPMNGPLAAPGVMMAGTDRVALDAVGLAVLKLSGANRAVMDTPIFGQEQIARAIELGLGVSGPEEIEVVSDDDRGRAYAAAVTDTLRRA